MKRIQNILIVAMATHLWVADAFAQGKIKIQTDGAQVPTAPVGQVPGTGSPVGQVPGGVAPVGYSGSAGGSNAVVYKNFQGVSRARKGTPAAMPVAHMIGALQDLIPGLSGLAPKGTAGVTETDVTPDDLLMGRGHNQQGAPNLDDPNFNWDTYKFPEGYRFYSGSKAAGEIGNGLCTDTNRNRVQVSSGYCDILYKVLSGQQGKCAHNALSQILADLDHNRKDYGLAPYCKNFKDLPREARTSVFQQILAGLITQESGWNPRATEPGWYQNGQLMQGKGLFQIGTWDGNQDKDCEGISSTIYDPTANMKCGACIALKNVAKDGVIASGSNNTNSRGLAAYFGPMRDGQAQKRSQVQRAVSSYCERSAVDPNAPGGGASGGQSVGR